MAKHRSIGERLSRAKSPEASRATLTDWIDNWQEDQIDILAQIEAGIRAMDRDVLISAAGQLRATTDKRITALRGVIAKLTKDPE